MTKLKWRQQSQRSVQSNQRQPLRHQHSLCLQNLKTTQKKHLITVKSQRSPSSSLMSIPQEFTTTCSAWKSTAMTFPKKSIIELKSKETLGECSKRAACGPPFLSVVHHSSTHIFRLSHSAKSSWWESPITCVRPEKGLYLQGLWAVLQGKEQCLAAYCPPTLGSGGWTVSGREIWHIRDRRFGIVGVSDEWLR